MGIRKIVINTISFGFPILSSSSDERVKGKWEIEMSLSLLPLNFFHSPNWKCFEFSAKTGGKPIEKLKRKIY